jgi:hypothetical protein
MIAALLKLGGFALPWWGRWVAIAALAATWGGWCALKMHQHDEAKFEAFKAEVQAAGDKQNFETQQTIKAHQALKEISDAEANTAAAQRDAALLRVRELVRAGRDRSFLPAPAPGAERGDRLCFAAGELDRGLRAAVERLQERTVANAAEGQRGVDAAVICRDWAKAIAGEH